jgi:GPH family glycoside/pentoside/hexuronide:cation symporter
VSQPHGGPVGTAEEGANASSSGASVSLPDLLSYSPSVVGLSGPLFIVQFYFLNFATDVLLLAPLSVGLLFAAGRVWDAVSDPIVGTLSDRTRTSLGRRRPWMLAGIPLLMVSFVMIWSPPEFESFGMYVWTAVALFSFYTSYTMYSVPHSALGAELTTDYHERNLIFGANSAAFTFGMLLAFGGMQYVMNAEDSRLAASRIGFGVAAVLPFILLVPPVRLREKAEYQGRGATSSLGAMRDVLANPHARLLLTVQFCQLAGSGVLGLMAPYLMRYVVKRPDLVGVMPGIFVVFTIFSIPIWVRITRHVGKKNAWIAGLFGSGFSFGMILLVGEGDLVLLGTLLCFAGFFAGCGMMVGNSILADVIDWDELQTGERKEGAYSAAWGFAIKSATAIIIVLVSIALQFSDFEANQAQSEATIWMLRILNGGLPLVMYTIAGFLFMQFGLDEVAHARVRAELDARATAGGASEGKGTPAS